MKSSLKENKKALNALKKIHLIAHLVHTHARGIENTYKVLQNLSKEDKFLLLTKFNRLNRQYKILLEDLGKAFADFEKISKIYPLELKKIHEQALKAIEDLD